MTHALLPLVAAPGIQRDGTFFDSEACTDGVWCRFYKGRPRKIGGYRLIDSGNSEIARTLFGVPVGNNLEVYVGRKSSVSSFILDQNGIASNEIDRTPIAEFVINDNNVWSFDVMPTILPGGIIESYIIAHVAPSGNDIGSQIEGPIFYGKINGTERLEPIYSTDTSLKGVQKSSGGICVSGNHLIKYGNGGAFFWTEPVKGDALSSILNWKVDNRQVGGSTKIVSATKTRGSNSETVFFLALETNFRASWNPTENTFDVNIVDENSTILASNSLISFQGMAAWQANGHYYLYNGAVQELKNDMNLRFFFGNLNYEAKEKIFGFYNAAYNELWWVGPLNGATECNHAVIYKVDANCWYDTPLDRAAAFQAKTYRFPIMSSSQPLNSVSSNNYPLWIHEEGANAVIGGRVQAIPSWFETNPIMMGLGGDDSDYQLRVYRIEPDFKQTGDMYVQLVSRGFPQSTPIYSDPVYFPPNGEKVDFSVNGRIISVRFGSDEMDGFFQCGKPLLDYGIKDSRGDARPSSHN